MHTYIKATNRRCGTSLEEQISSILLEGEGRTLTISAPRYVITITGILAHQYSKSSLITSTSSPNNFTTIRKVGGSPSLTFEKVNTNENHHEFSKSLN